MVVNPKELTFTKLYSQAFLKVRKQELARIGRQVATLCATLGEYPIVRYCETSMSTSEGPMAKIVAASIQEQIDQFYRVNPDAIVRDLFHFCATFSAFGSQSSPHLFPSSHSIGQ